MVENTKNTKPEREKPRALVLGFQPAGDVRLGCFPLRLCRLPLLHHLRIRHINDKQLKTLMIPAGRVKRK
jgi:hypothetical protein